LAAFFFAGAFFGAALALAFAFFFAAMVVVSFG
jgi:hypothetical protein